MSTTQESKQLVMVGVDGSEDGVRALRYAVQEAVRLGASLRLVHVQQGIVVMAPMMPLIPDQSLHEIAAEILKRAEQQARQFGYEGPGLEAVLALGPRHRALLQHSKDASCVVTGRRSSPLQHLVGGSTTSSLAAHATVPVISVPETWQPGPPAGMVVVGVDESHYSAGVLQAGWAQAQARGARLQVVHAWRPLHEYDVAIGDRVLASDWTRTTLSTLTDWVRDEVPESGVEWSVRPQYENAAVALHEAAESADLLVLGRHGHGAPHGLGLGSTARTMLRTSPCPVMVVPSGGVRATRREATEAQEEES
jgi:nucleotide-binding universal stress UspA family protein